MSVRFSQQRHEVNLWVVPLKMSIAALLLFGVTVTLDTLAAGHIIHLPDWFTMGGIDDARAILGAMLGCVSTVLALIFSVALLVLSMVANLFGPRLLYRFVQDWVTQVCIGLFMGAFIYVFLVFLVTHKDDHSSFIPQVSLITSWLVVLSAFAFLVFYSHRVAVLIQNPDAVGRIVDDLRQCVHQQRSLPTGARLREREHATVDLVDENDAAAVRSSSSGYLQTIDHTALIRAAARADAHVTFSFRPGQFVLEGETIALVAPSSADPALQRLIRRSVTLGRHRVLFQDLEFGVAQIVEIAIRALSPAVNDTFTGVACVDLLGEALTVLAEAPYCDGRYFDANGNARLQVPPLLIDRLVKQAFDQIRQAAVDNPAVIIRLLSTTGRLAARFTDEGDRRSLLEQANAVWETATSKALVKMDYEDIDAARRKALDTITATNRVS